MINATWRHDLVTGVVLLALSVATAGLILLRPIEERYTPDSATYIQEARSFAATGDFKSDPYGVYPLDETAGPSWVFPPGFPVVLAVGSKLGVEPALGALLVSAAAAVLTPFALYWALLPVLRRWWALGATTLSALSPGVLENAGKGLTDSLALLLAVCTVGLILRSQSRRAIIAAGLLAGASYVIRNASIALLAAAAVYYGYAWLMDPRQRRARFIDACAFGLASGLPVAALTLRNLKVFGHANPYMMPPSTVGPLENIVFLVRAGAFDLTSLPVVRTLIVSPTVALLLAAAMALALLVAYRSPRIALSPDARRAVVLFVAYLMIGSALLVAARSRFQWGEMINQRHLMQYTPFLFALTAVLASSWRGANPQRAAAWGFIVAATVGVLDVAYQAPVAATRLAQFGQENPQVRVLAIGSPFLCAAPSGEFLVSNWAETFKINCNAPVRAMVGVNQSRTPEVRDLVDSKLAPDDTVLSALLKLGSAASARPVTVALFPGRYGLDPQDLPLTSAATGALEHKGWRVVVNSEAALVAKRATGP